MTTPEDAQANGFAEAFVKVMVKLVHTALVEKRDPRKMVNSYLMAYRATPHKVTGRSPAELLFNRKIRTKLPGLQVQQRGEMDREVRKRHQEEKGKQKTYADEKSSDRDRHFFSDPSSAISDRSQIDPTGTTSPSSVLLLLCTVTCGGK